MLNKKYTYLIFFSIFFCICIIICIYLNNIFLLLSLLGFFTICQTWVIVLLLDKEVKHVSQQNENIPTNTSKDNNELDVQIQETQENEVKEINEEINKKDHPDITDTIYVGEEMSLDDIKKIKEDNKSWYSKSYQRINNSILEMQKILDK